MIQQVECTSKGVECLAAAAADSSGRCQRVRREVKAKQNKRCKPVAKDRQHPMAVYQLENILKDN